MNNFSDSYYADRETFKSVKGLDAPESPKEKGHSAEQPSPFASGLLDTVMPIQTPEHVLNPKQQKSRKDDDLFVNEIIFRTNDIQPKIHRRGEQ